MEQEVFFRDITRRLGWGLAKRWHCVLCDDGSVPLVGSQVLKKVRHVLNAGLETG
jgi:hypothetical protein